MSIYPCIPAIPKENNAPLCGLCREEVSLADYHSNNAWTHLKGEKHDPFHRSCLLSSAQFQLTSNLQPICPYRDHLIDASPLVQQSPITRLLVKMGIVAPSNYRLETLSERIEKKFDPKYATTFRENGYPISELPTKQLEETFCDYPKIAPDTLEQHAAMTLVDGLGRKALAIRVKDRSSPHVVNVFTLAQRHPDGDRGEKVYTATTTIEKSILRNRYHQHFKPAETLGFNSCPACPLEDHLRLDTGLISRLLNGTDPVWELDGDLPERQEIPQASFCTSALKALKNRVHSPALNPLDSNSHKSSL